MFVGTAEAAVLAAADRPAAGAAGVEAAGAVEVAEALAELVVEVWEVLLRDRNRLNPLPMLLVHWPI